MSWCLEIFSLDYDIRNLILDQLKNYGVNYIRWKVRYFPQRPIVRKYCYCRCLFIFLLLCVSAMIKQFLSDVVWRDIDYLIIDTPPGTSDEHLAVIENLKAYNPDGAILVTTPQVLSGKNGCFLLLMQRQLFCNLC